MFWTMLSSESFLRRPFADPSLKLRALAQGFGSGQRLSIFFCHSERSFSGVKNLILFRVSDWRIPSGDPSATPQGDRKGSFLHFGSGSGWQKRVISSLRLRTASAPFLSFWASYSVIPSLRFRTASATSFLSFWTERQRSEESHPFPK
jgi:hypothetical protein